MDSEFYLFLTIATSLLLALAGSYLWANVRADEELGKTPLSEERCGARFGPTSYTAPFVRAAAYEHFLVLSAVRQRVVIRYALATIAVRVGRLGTEVLVSGVTERSLRLYFENDSKLLSILRTKIDANTQ